jgi:hypothetical protein
MSEPGRVRRTVTALLLAVSLCWAATSVAQWRPRPDSDSGSPAATYLLAFDLSSTAALSDATRKRHADGGNDLPKTAAPSRLRPLTSHAASPFDFPAYNAGLPDAANRSAIPIRAPPGHPAHR